MTLRKKWIALFIFLFLCVLTELGAPVRAAEGSDLLMEVEGGFDGIARITSAVPFKIYLESKGEEVAGEIQVSVYTSDREKSIYVIPFHIAPGVRKEFYLTAPVLTMNRKVEIKAVRGRKTLVETEFGFKKLIPPELPVIGVLTEDKNSLRELNGLKLQSGSLSSLDPIAQQKMMLMRAAGVATAIKEGIQADIAAEMITLDAGLLPEDIQAFSAFDVIVITNFDTSTLSDKQTAALMQWVGSGKTLIAGTGPNWNKVYAGLPENMKSFAIRGTTSLFDSGSISRYAESAPMDGALGIVLGDAKGGRVVLEDGGTPLAVSYPLGEGTVAVLAFDPALAPFAGWEGSQSFWKKLIQTAGNLDDGAGVSKFGGQYSSTLQLSSRFGYITNEVPESKTPPFSLLALILSAYILLVGPVVYLILKFRDKRDLNWVIIPVAAFVFMGIVYFAGFKTRFTAAVLNAVSFIRLDAKAGLMDIETTLSAFNNKNRTMTLQYDRNADIAIGSQYSYYGIYTSSPQGMDNARVTAKYTLEDVITCELYDSPLWTSRMIGARKTQPLAGSLVSDATLKNGKIHVSVKNNTGIALKDAFLLVGNHAVDIGNLSPEGEEISIPVGDVIANENVDAFLDARYGPQGMWYGRNVPDEVREKARKRDILSQFMNSGILDGSPQGFNLWLIALNEDDPGHGLVINGREPEKYNMNVLYSQVDLSLESNTQVEIPGGIIKAAFLTGQGNYDSFNDNQVMRGIRLFQNSRVEFRYSVPENIDIKEFTINWDTFIPYYSKSISSQVQQQTMQNTYQFQIYNFKTLQWEEAGERYHTDQPADYIGPEGEILVSAGMDADNPVREEVVLYPKLSVKGVAK